LLFVVTVNIAVVAPGAFLLGVLLFLSFFIEFEITHQSSEHSSVPGLSLVKALIASSVNGLVFTTSLA
jgi:hypothetical protein